MEEEEMDRNSSRKWKLKKKVKNSIKDMSGTIHCQDDKTLKCANLCSLVG